MVDSDSASRGWLNLSLHEPFVRIGDPVAERHAVLPSKLVQLAHVQQLPRRPIRLGRIKGEDGLWVDDLADKLGQLANGEVFAGAHIDMRRLVVVFDQK